MYYTQVITYCKLDSTTPVRCKYHSKKTSTWSGFFKITERYDCKYKGKCKYKKTTKATLYPGPK